MQCVESGAVRYVTRKENVLPLEVPVDAATNAAALAEFKVRGVEGLRFTVYGLGWSGAGDVVV